MRNNQSGFTLTEMIVAITISAIMIIIVMSFMTNTIVKNSIEMARSDLLQEAQLSIDLISKDIRLSASVDDVNRWPDNNAPDTADSYSWVANDSVLILATAAEDGDHNVIFEDALHYITYKNNNIYYVENNTLYKRTLAAPIIDNLTKTSCPSALADAACPEDKRLIEGVTSFSLRYLNSLDIEVDPAEARSVEVSISVVKEKYNQQIEADYITRSVFRNE